MLGTFVALPLEIDLPSPERAVLSRWLEEVHSEMASHRYDMALKALNKALRFVKERKSNKGAVQQLARIHFFKAELLMQLGRWERAMEDIDLVLGEQELLTDVSPSLLISALVASAQISANYGDYNESLAALDKALELALDRGSELDAAKVYLELGTVFCRIGEPNQGELNLNKVLEIVGEPRSSQGAVLLAGVYTQKGLTEFRNRRYSEARLNYHRGLEILSRHAPETTLQADIFRYLGILCSVEGDYRQAFSYHRRALEFYVLLRASLGKAKVYNSIGQTCMEMSCFDEALHFMHKAERLSKKLGADAELANTYGKLGNIYREIGDYQRAVDYHLKDIDMCRRFGNYRALAFAVMNLGLSYRGQGDLDEAIHFLEDGRQRFEELQDRVNWAKVTLELADCYLEAGEPDNALLLLDGFLQDCESLSSYDKGKALWLKAMALSEIDEKGKASSLLEEAVQALSSHGSVPELAKAYYERARLVVFDAVQELEGDQLESVVKDLFSAFRLASRFNLSDLKFACLESLDRLGELFPIELLIEKSKHFSLQNNPTTYFSAK